MPLDRRAARLIARLRAPELQERLEEGFERSLSAYLLEQWDDRRYLTEPQMERIQALLDRYASVLSVKPRHRRKKDQHASSKNDR